MQICLYGLAHEFVPTLSANLAFFVMVTLRDAYGVGKGEDVVGIFGFVFFVPVAWGVEGFWIMVPGGRCIGAFAAKDKFDHVAFHI